MDDGRWTMEDGRQKIYDGRWTMEQVGSKGCYGFKGINEEAQVEKAAFKCTI